MLYFNKHELPYHNSSRYSKMGSQERTFPVGIGQLVKMRLRPQILNEHVESSRTVQGTVSSGNIVGQVFRASHDNINSIYLTLESADVTIIDNFESYTSSAQLQAVWISTGALATLDTLIYKDGLQSMRLPTATVGVERTKTFAATDMTDFTGTFHWYQTDDYSVQQVRVFIGDGTNTKSAPITSAAINTWQKISIDINAMTEDGGGTTNDAAITKIGFRTSVKKPGSYAYVDNLISTPLPGTVQLKLWDMGDTLPESGVASLEDGVQYTTLGDIASESPSASYNISLIGGKSIYHLHGFTAGVANEIPSNNALTPGNYYALTLHYVDTNIQVYGPDPSYTTKYYTNGYAFTTVAEVAPLTQIGIYSDIMFGIFSTQDAYIVASRAEANAEPGDRATYYSFVEDSDMKITDVLNTHGVYPPQSNMVDLVYRPTFLPKGGKFELYYKDDYTDTVTLIIFGIQFIYIEEPVNG